MIFQILISTDEVESSDFAIVVGFALNEDVLEFAFGRDDD